jgi:hypothetical protein
MGPVGKAYAALVAAGELKPDEDQKRAVQALDRFGRDAASQDGGFLKKLFGKKEPPRGAYLWGGVGRGKSMLMELAFDNLDIEPSAGPIFTPSCWRCMAPPRGAEERRRRPRHPGCRADRGRGEVPRIRRDDGHQQRRCDDYVAPVHRHDR